MVCNDKNMDYSDSMDLLGEVGKTVNLRCVRLGDLPRATPFPFQVGALGYIKDNWHNEELVYGSVTFALVFSTPGGMLHRMINGREVRERCPMFHISRPGNHWRNLSPDPWDEIYFVYKPAALPAFEGFGCQVPKRHDVVITPILVDMLRKLIKLVINHQVAGNIDRIDALSFRIIQECLITATVPPDDNPLDELVKEVLSLIRLNHRSVINLKPFLRKRGVGYRTFLRRWHTVTKQTPSQYALELRMAEAREMLRETGVSIKSIADELGFIDPLYFSRIFRNKVGMSPSIFRKIKVGDMAE